MWWRSNRACPRQCTADYVAWIKPPFLPYDRTGAWNQMQYINTPPNMIPLVNMLKVSIQLDGTPITLNILKTVVDETFQASTDAHSNK